jgi:hypothetical protein
MPLSLYAWFLLLENCSYHAIYFIKRISRINLSVIVTWVKTWIYFIDCLNFLEILIKKQNFLWYWIIGTGWGRAHKRAVSKWYTSFEKDPEKLARLVTKFKNRESWSHKDVVRLAHTSTSDKAVGFILRYISKFQTNILNFKEI